MVHERRREHFARYNRIGAIYYYADDETPVKGITQRSARSWASSICTYTSVTLFGDGWRAGTCNYLPPDTDAIRRLGATNG